MQARFWLEWGFRNEFEPNEGQKRFQILHTTETAL